MLNETDTIICLIAGQIKEDIVQVSEYFSEPKFSGRSVRVELDLSNYATKANLKNARSFDTSKFANKVTTSNYNKFTSNTLDAKIIQKKLVNAKINEVRNEISSVTILALTIALNANIKEIKNKESTITNLVTTALTAVENKILSVSSLVKKIDYITTVGEVKNEITTDHDHDNSRKFYCKISTRKFNKQK